MSNPSYRAIPGRDGAIRFIEADGHKCANCRKKIPQCQKFCWRCAFFGGMRR
jgi:hypothetical protein